MRIHFISFHFDRPPTIYSLSILWFWLIRIIDAADTAVIILFFCCFVCRLKLIIVVGWGNIFLIRTRYLSIFSRFSILQILNALRNYSDICFSLDKWPNFLLALSLYPHFLVKGRHCFISFQNNTKCLSRENF